MEANKILQTDVLDIIFEGRNKEYGAYNLRKTYSRRLVTALIGMVGLIVVLFAGYVIAGGDNKTGKQVMEVTDVVLKTVKEEPAVVTPPPPPPPKPQLPQVATIQYTPPRIVRDEEVTKEEMPEMNDIEDAKIGKITQDGIKEDVVAPPAEDNNRNIIEAPKKLENDDKPFTKVEIESQYPGGAGAWMRYLSKTFRYPESAQETGVQGTVTVQFIVDREGNVSNVEAISGPTTGGLREEAIRVIQKSGKWEPAIQNGQKVKSYKKQPITFKLETE